MVQFGIIIATATGEKQHFMTLSRILSAASKWKTYFMMQQSQTVIWLVDLISESTPTMAKTFGAIMYVHALRIARFAGQNSLSVSAINRL